MNLPTGKAAGLALLRDARTESFVVDPFVLVGWRDWTSKRAALLAEISSRWTGRMLAVRSSSAREADNAAATAGKYETHLGIPADGGEQLAAAIDSVFSSFKARSPHSNGDPADNAVIVQVQVTEVEAAGVITTRDHQGRPYFVLELDPGSTTSVTGGRAHQRVRVAHCAPAVPAAYRAPIAAAREIIDIAGEDDLVIELALDPEGRVHVFQAWSRGRPSSRHDDRLTEMRLGEIAGQLRDLDREDGMALSDMGDWNPAEILGPAPGALDVSLYGFLITDGVWAAARASLGYHDVGNVPLLRQVDDKPYVDLSLSLASLVPAPVPASLRRRIVSGCLARLRAKPELHDKLEFELLPTVGTIAGPAQLSQRLEADLTRQDAASFHLALQSMTAALIDEGPEIVRSTRQATLELWSANAALSASPAHSDPAARVRERLALCRELGTYPFARIARLAFAARDLLSQLVSADIVDAEWLARFQASIETPASVIARSVAAVRQGTCDLGALAALIGHLRPHVYDITSPRYADQLEALVELMSVDRQPRPTPEEDPDPDADRIDDALREAGLQHGAGSFVRLCREAISEREWAKFRFSAAVSDALEDLAELGEALDLEREQLQQIALADLLAAQGTQAEHTRRRGLGQSTSGREDRVAIYRPGLICAPDDVYVINEPDPRPTFITDRRLVAPAYHVQPARIQSAANGAIAVIEAADPGFDWLFAAGILGLVTLYGGSASHMAIRCEELRIPAAIGVGNRLFEPLVTAKGLELDCRRHSVRAVG